MRQARSVLTSQYPHQAKVTAVKSVAPWLTSDLGTPQLAGHLGPAGRHWNCCCFWGFGLGRRVMAEPNGPKVNIFEELRAQHAELFPTAHGQDAARKEPDQEPRPIPERQIKSWYLAGPVLSVVLLVLVPAWWASSHLPAGLMPRPFASADYLAGAPGYVIVLRGQTLALGWAFFAVAVTIAAIGAVVTRKERAQEVRAAVVGNSIGVGAVIVGFVIAIVLTILNNVIVFAPYAHGGIIGIGL